VFAEMKTTCSEFPLQITDIINELYDMIRPKVPYYITEDDLVQSGVANTVITILIDTQGFCEYDGREMFVSLNVNSE
jgi:serine/threonine-protein phosphatase 2A regulatory subunit B''